MALISHLVLQGVDINTANLNDEGWTALHYAAHEGYE
jgi:ankyrin repeat protein